MSADHIPGQWPAALRTSPTRDLIRRDQQRAAEQAWQDEVLVRAAASFAACSTVDEIHDAAARLAARVIQAGVTAVQQRATSLPE